MASDFARLVDVPFVQSLLDRLWKVWNIPMGVVDPGGTVLAGVGWSDFCVRFHRKHPDTLRHCFEMENYFRDHLHGREQVISGKPYEFRCGNGMVDIEAPFVFEGRHLANLYLGQFFYEPPDFERYRGKAQQCGFEEKSYMENLNRVPVASRERAAELLGSMERLIALVARKGRQALERDQKIKELERRQAHLVRQNLELRQSRLLQAATGGEDESAFRESLASLLRVLELSKVSLWLRDPPSGGFACALVLVDGQDVPCGVGAEQWPGSEGPPWLDELQAGRSVGREPGLAPLGMEAMAVDGLACLDVPLGAGMGFCGVLRCERSEILGPWLSDDLEFAEDTAEYLSVLVFAAQGRGGEQRESELRYRLLFNAETDAILIFDGQTRKIVEANESAVRLYGWSRRQMTGMLMDDLSAEPEGGRARLADISAGLLRRIPLAKHRSRDGRVFPVELSCGSFPWKGRELLTAIIRDVSVRQHLTQVKDDMLSAVSHEIRTPLTAMIGFTDLLLKNDFEPQQQREYLQIVASQGERLRELVDNLLDLQRIRAGFGMLNSSSVAVRQLLESALMSFYQSRGLHDFALDCPENLRAIQGDERHLLRALVNLVSNAVKYSPKGGTVTLGACSEGPCVTLWVRDQGIGIDPAAQEQIFERFFRVSQGDGQEIGGTGLGLSLVKAIVDGHGGRVRVESTPGEGSTFFLSLPAAGCSVVS